MDWIANKLLGTEEELIERKIFLVPIQHEQLDQITTSITSQILILHIFNSALRLNTCQTSYSSPFISYRST